MNRKKWTSLFLALTMVITTVFSGNCYVGSALAAQTEEEAVKEKITVYLAAQGVSDDEKSVTIDKKAVQVEAGTTADVLVKSVLDASEYKDNYEILDTGYGPYLESIHGMGTKQDGDNWYYWSFYVNGTYSTVGMGSYELQDNDKISLIYSYQDESTVAKDFVDDQEKNPTQEEIAVLQERAEAQQKLMAEKIYEAQFGKDGIVPGIENPNALYTVFSLLRAGYQRGSFYQNVYEKVESQLKALKEEGKVTDADSGKEITEESILTDGAEMVYAKIVLVLTAMGKDAASVGGFNLIEKMADREVYEASSSFYTREATMLLALDCANYALPVGEKYITRTELVNRLADGLEEQIASSIQYGVDMAAMIIQPLAPYQKENNLAQQEKNDAFDIEKIKKTCAKGIHFLESMQSADGLYGDSWSANNVWSLAQVMTVMGQFGISPVSEEDGSDFIKNGKTVLDAVGKFVSVEEETIEPSLMSYQPEQLLRGITACVRVMGQSKALYDATDVVEGVVPTPTPDVAVTPTPSVTATVNPMPDATATAAPSNTPDGQENVPKMEAFKLDKTNVVVAPGKSVSIPYTAKFAAPATTQAVVMVSSANSKVAQAAVVHNRIKISVPKKAVKGAVTTVFVSAENEVVRVRVAVRNRTKAVKAKKQTITVKKGKQRKVIITLKGENAKKKITDSVKVYGNSSAIQLGKKITLQKTKLVFYVKGLKRSKSVMKVKVGNKTAKINVRVK